MGVDSIKRAGCESIKIDVTGSGIKSIKRARIRQTSTGINKKRPGLDKLVLKSIKRARIKQTSTASMKRDKIRILVSG